MAADVATTEPNTTTCWSEAAALLVTLKFLRNLRKDIRSTYFSRFYANYITKIPINVAMRH